MFVADLHNDVLQRAMNGEDISKQNENGHSDLIRLKDSCIDLEVFVVWIDRNHSKEETFNRANKLYDILETLERENKFFKITKTVSDIYAAKNNNILAAPISIEGGEPLEDKIENLYHFINRGLFYFGPTWNHSLSWVSSSYDEIYNKKNIKNLGLNNFGIEVINTCNENGVIVDLSHIGEKSFWDIAKISSKPFIASHSSVHKLCPHFRNLKDDQILAIKHSQGLIGLNPYPFFIDPKFQAKEKIFRKEISHKIEKITFKEENSFGNIKKAETFAEVKKNNKKTFRSFTFTAEYEDNMTLEIFVEYKKDKKDFEKAEKEALFFSKMYGQMPHFLKIYNDKIYIHLDHDEPRDQIGRWWAEYNKRAFHINPGRNYYENVKCIVQTYIYSNCAVIMVHELAHVIQQLTGVINPSKWMTARKLDNKKYASEYAKTNAYEDFAESLTAWVVVRYKSNKISKSDIKKFNRFIPNRFKLFDEMNFNMYPL